MSQALLHPSPSQSSPTASQQVDSAHSPLAMLLDAELDYAPQARGGFVNHLAMTLIAAARLGASEARLQEVFDSHTQDGYLIRRETPSWLAKSSHLNMNDSADAVSRRVPKLASAIDARWFHAVIRLELALDAEHPGQVESALLDWEQVAQPLPALSAARGAESLLEVMRALERSTESEGRFSSLRAAAAHPPLVDLLGRAALGDRALSDAAEFALCAHIGRKDFTTLHMVTGTRAARAVAAYLERDDAIDLGEYLAHALVAAYVTCGAPLLPSAARLAELRAQAIPDWMTISKKAITSDDAHVIKLTYACRLEQQATKEPLYQWVAARNNGLL